MFITNIKKVIIFSIVALLVGCAYGDKSIDENKPSALQVYPKSISAGEQFRLTFPQLHPKNLSVRSPSGKWFSIQSGEEGALLIPQKEYSSATELKINTKALKGITWVNGK